MIHLLAQFCQGRCKITVSTCIQQWSVCIECLSYTHMICQERNLFLRKRSSQSECTCRTIHRQYRVAFAGWMGINWFQSKPCRRSYDKFIINAVRSSNWVIYSVHWNCWKASNLHTAFEFNGHAKKVANDVYKCQNHADGMQWHPFHVLLMRPAFMSTLRSNNSIKVFCLR